MKIFYKIMVIAALGSAFLYGVKPLPTKPITGSSDYEAGVDWKKSFEEMLASDKMWQRDMQKIKHVDTSKLPIKNFKELDSVHGKEILENLKIKEEIQEMLDFALVHSLPSVVRFIFTDPTLIHDGTLKNFLDKVMHSDDSSFVEYVVLLAKKEGVQADKAVLDVALQDAIEKENIERVKALLVAGANTNSRDIDGRTPLMFVPIKTDISKDIIALLIAKNADVTIKNKAGYTLLDLLRGYLRNNHKLQIEKKEDQHLLDLLAKEASLLNACIALVKDTTKMSSMELVREWINADIARTTKIVACLRVTGAVCMLGLGATGLFNSWTHTVTLLPLIGATLHTASGYFRRTMITPENKDPQLAEELTSRYHSDLILMSLAADLGTGYNQGKLI